MNKTKIVALIGKSGAGKDSIVRSLVERYSNIFNEIISCTTRPPREGERQGVNYHFLSANEFAKKILNGDMLEATEFNGWLYGTALSNLSKDKINIGVFNPEGIRCILEDNFVDLTIYYVRAADKERLLRQLNREENPDVREIIRRFSTDEKDFSCLDFDYQEIINQNKEDLSKAVDFIFGQNS